MTTHIQVPVRVVGTQKWGNLNALGVSHEICGETVNLKDANFSFAGGHRVRLYHFRKNVHWRITTGMDIDIAEVQPATSPKAQHRK